MTRCDVIVVGGGAMGSAAAWWLARRGVEVALLEQFEPGHVRGGSHGTLRIFRFAYDRAPYLRMAMAALPLWRELETDANAQLYTATGAIDHGDAASLARVAECMRGAGAAFEVLSAAEAQRRWPAMRFTGDVLFHAEGGRVHADATVAAAQAAARTHGASIVHHSKVLDVTAADGGAVVTTAAETYMARVAIVAAGSWTPKLLATRMDLPTITVTREQPAYFRPTESTDWPSFIHHGATVAESIYGLGDGQSLVKVGEHGTGTATDPDTPSPQEPLGVERLRAYAHNWLPGLDPDPVSVDSCLYDSTPDSEFVLRREGPIVAATGFSGHGFKFVPLVGRMLADLAAGTRDADAMAE